MKLAVVARVTVEEEGDSEWQHAAARVLEGATVLRTICKYLVPRRRRPGVYGKYMLVKAALQYLRTTTKFLSLLIDQNDFTPVDRERLG